MNTIFNNVSLSGYLTKEVRVNSHDGKSVANFTLVTNSPGGKGNPDVAMYHDCSLWGPLVDSIKGKLEGSPYVQIIGELRYKPQKDGKVTNKNPFINVREIYIPAIKAASSNED